MQGGAGRSTRGLLLLQAKREQTKARKTGGKGEEGQAVGKLLCEDRAFGGGRRVLPSLRSQGWWVRAGM
jgi:hypothetical protein